ncbi:MAG: hypothetical protein AAF413_01830 [Patescibacteria group bacterium]
MRALTKGFIKRKNTSELIHGLVRLALPLIVFGFVSIGLSFLAYGVIFLSKWRVLWVKSRYWLINLKSNTVDIIVGLSFVSLMSNTDVLSDLHILAAFIGWTVLLRTKSKPLWMALQAVTAQFFGVLAIFYAFSPPSITVSVLGVWFVSYFSAVHVLNIGEGDVRSPLAHVWGLFSMQLAWVLSHWQIWYSFIPQIALILTVLFGSLTALLLLHRHNAASSQTLRQISVSAGIIIVAILILSDWQDKTI